MKNFFTKLDTYLMEYKLNEPIRSQQGAQI
jgi:hypothetical protein